MGEYHFTGDELGKLLNEAIALYQEYQDRHGYPQEGAQVQAVLDTMDSLDEEFVLCQSGKVDHAARVA